MSQDGSAAGTRPLPPLHTNSASPEQTDRAAVAAIGTAYQRAAAAGPTASAAVGDAGAAVTPSRSGSGSGSASTTPSAVSRLIGQYELTKATPPRSLSTTSAAPASGGGGAADVLPHTPPTGLGSAIDRRASAPPHIGTAAGNKTGGSPPPPPPPAPATLLPLPPSSPLSPASPTPPLTPAFPRSIQLSLAAASSTNGTSAGGRRPFPPVLPLMPPASPRSPMSPGHSRKRTMDDTGVDEVESYLRAPAGPLSPRRLQSSMAAAAAGAVARRAALQSSPRSDAPSALSPMPSPTHPTPTASPSVASVRHKLQSFRTLPLNLPSSSVLAAAAAFAHAEECKTNDATPRRGIAGGVRIGPPGVGLLSPMSGRAFTPGASAASPGRSAGASSVSPPLGSARAGAAAGALSPTHFSYWEKRNIWVQREQEEMRAKVHLKKVLRKINQSNMILPRSYSGRASVLQGQGYNGINAALAAGSENNKSPPPSMHAQSPGLKPAPVPASPSSPPALPASSSFGAGGGALRTSPTPPSFPVALVNGAVGVAAARSSISLPLSPVMAATASPSASAGAGAAAPSPGHPSPPASVHSAPSVTISELSAAASNLQLTAHLGSVHLVKELTSHLSAMEVAECRFTSAPQIMWALKALTLTGAEAPPADPASANAGGSAGASASGAVSPQPCSPRDMAVQRKAAVERIIAEQTFAPSVVNYIRSHTHAQPSTAASSSSGPSSSPKGASAGAGPFSKRLPPPLFPNGPPAPMHAHSQSTTVLEAPRAAAMQHAVVAQTAAAAAAAADGSATKHAATLAPSSAAAAAAASASTGAVASGPVANASASSTRSNSLQTELDHEWSRRHIPKVRASAPLAMRARIEAKLREEAEELAERRKNVVEKMINLNIWKDRSTVTPASIVTSLGTNRFDLLRFSFELTELAEMEGRGLLFESAPQAMAALRVLYERMPAPALSALYDSHHISPAVQSYLEARRGEISSSRLGDESDSVGSARLVVPPQRGQRPKASSSGGGLRLNVLSPSGGSGGPGASSAAASPAASPLAHHRAISLVEFVEMLSSGNLLTSPPPLSQARASDGSSPPPLPPVPGASPVTAESLAWVLSDVGLDMSEVSIDDLIQMQQHPSLVRSFASVRQVVSALQVLYTAYDEVEIEQVGLREKMQPKVVQYLLAQARSAGAAAAAGSGAVGGAAAASGHSHGHGHGHGGASASVGDVSMLAETLSLSLSHSHGPGLGGGVVGAGLGSRKRSRLARQKRAKEIRARIVECQLEMLEEEMDVETDEQRVERGPSAPAAGRARPKYQMYELQRADHEVLLHRQRRVHPLGPLTLPQLCAALNAPPASALIAPEALPLSTGDLAQLVVEMALPLGEGDCEVDLLDLDLMARESAELVGAGKDPLRFRTAKQCLWALQLLNVDCVSQAEFEASCARAAFEPEVVTFLQTHSASAAAGRLLEHASRSAAPAAKYALLEYEMAKQEELELDEEEEMELEMGMQMQLDADGEEQGQGQGGVEFGASADSARARHAPSYAVHELRFSEDGLSDERESVLESATHHSSSRQHQPLSAMELSVRLQQSNLLAAGGDPSSSILSLPHALPLTHLDRELLLSDLAALEQQGGLKFKHARHLVSALYLLQDEEFAHDEDGLYEACEAQHFSPSVVTFLLQLHRSPARAARLAVVRGRRSGPNSARGRGGGGGGFNNGRQAGQAQPQSVLMQSRIREEGEEGEWTSELVASAHGALAQQVKMLRLLDDDGAASFSVEEQGGGGADQLGLGMELSHSSLEHLPAHVVRADLAALSRAGLRFPTAKQLVRVLELVHDGSSAAIDADRVALVFPGAAAGGGAVSPGARAKHVEFLLNYRRENLERDALVRDGKGDGRASQQRFSVARTVTEVEFSLEEEEGDDDGLDQSEPAQRRRRRAAASRLSAALRSSHLFAPELSSSADLGAESLERTCVEMDFSLSEVNDADLDALVRLDAGGGGALRSVKPVIMALRLLNEAERMAHDQVGVGVDSKASELPAPLAQFVLLRTHQSKELREGMLRRRMQARDTGAGAGAGGGAGAKQLPSTSSRRAVTMQQLEDSLCSMHFSDESEGVDGSAAATVAVSPGSMRQRHDAALRSAVVQMDLDLSEVSLDEVALLERHSQRPGRKVSARQAVQVLRLLHCDFTGGITRDRVDAELVRMEAAAAGAGGAKPSSARQRHRTIELLFEIEADLLEEEAARATAIHAPRARTVSRLPPPLPEPVVTVVGGSDSDNGVSPTGVLSPPPPPFPPQLRQSSAESSDPTRHSVLSPALPLYPYPSQSSSGDGGGGGGGVPNPSTTPALPAIHASRTGTSSHHVRFHSRDMDIDELVDYINDSGLCKSQYYSASDLPQPLSSLNLPALMKQAENILQLKQDKRVRGALYDNPAHCIRCLHSGAMPSCLSGEGSGSPHGSPCSSASSSSSSSPNGGVGASLLTLPPGHRANAPSTSSVRKAPSSAATADADQALIDGHIRNSLHFRNATNDKGSKELMPIQETEPPVTAGCCGQSKCVVQ